MKNKKRNPLPKGNNSKPIPATSDSKVVKAKNAPPAVTATALIKKSPNNPKKVFVHFNK
jgi:hypothetical protein